MKKAKWLFLIGLIFVFALAACGTKSKEDVTASLDKKVGEMTGYKSEAKLTLQTGTEPQVYEVEIWHKKPSYYRVLLKNEKKEQSQMILRNDEGVFVLTPALNKSFRFQSDWPQNSSQAYLYESLIKDIMKDTEATFTPGEKDYVFVTKTNYQNHKMLPKQEISLDKSTLAPKTVRIMDQDMNALVLVEFSKFQFNPKYDADAFDMKKNMTASKLEVPVMADGISNQDFMVLYPTVQPAGVELMDEKEFSTAHGKRVIMTFSGEGKSFTLIQEKSKVQETVAPVSVSGEPVDLGYTVGAASDSSLTWTYDGVDYTIASNDLSQDEMLMVARSIEGKASK